MANETLVETIAYQGFTIEVHQDWAAEKPNGYCDMLSTFVHWHDRYDWDLDGIKEYGEPFNFYEHLAGFKIDDLPWRNDFGRDEFKYKNLWRSEDHLREIIVKLAHANAVIIPVALYDHSGISFYEGTGSHMVDPGGWDSGQVGFLFATKERLIQEGGLKHKGIKSLTRKVREYGERMLRAELKMWDQWATGQVDGYKISKDGELIDSCRGFYGDYREYLLPECRSIIDSIIAADSKKHFENLKTQIRNRVPLYARVPLLKALNTRDA